jgi:hypothetical protein
MDNHITRSQATQYLRSKGYDVGNFYLMNLAGKKQGPSYSRYGRNSVYAIPDLDKWIESPQFKATKIVTRLAA